MAVTVLVAHCKRGDRVGLQGGDLVAESLGGGVSLVVVLFVLAARRRWRDIDSRRGGGCGNERLDKDGVEQRVFVVRRADRAARAEQQCLACGGNTTAWCRASGNFALIYATKGGTKSEAREAENAEWRRQRRRSHLRWPVATRAQSGAPRRVRRVPSSERRAAGRRPRRRHRRR